MTHLCRPTSNGKCTVRGTTRAQRLRKPRQAVQDARRRRRHWPIPPQGVGLTSVLLGHERYDGRPRHGSRRTVGLEKSLGVQPLVGFNWNNGFLTSVHVTFEGIPKDKSLPEIGEVATRAVLKEFKQEPKQIVISFTIKP